jgi:hypothetical protein
MVQPAVGGGASAPAAPPPAPPLHIGVQCKLGLKWRWKTPSDGPSLKVLKGKVSEAWLNTRKQIYMSTIITSKWNILLKQNGESGRILEKIPTFFLWK